MPEGRILTPSRISGLLPACWRANREARVLAHPCRAGWADGGHRSPGGGNNATHRFARWRHQYHAYALIRYFSASGERSIPSPGICGTSTHPLTGWGVFTNSASVVFHIR